MCQPEAERQPLPQRLHQPTLRRIWRILEWSAGALVALIGLAAAYIELGPFISVTVASSLVANDPYEPLLMVKNAGYLSVYNLVFACEVTIPILPGHPGPLNFSLELHNRATQEAGDNLSPEPVLAPQDSVTKTCATRVNGLTPKGMDFSGTVIDFVVTYRPFAPFTPARHNVVRFASRKAPNGEIVWIPIAYSTQHFPAPPQSTK